MSSTPDQLELDLHGEEKSLPLPRLKLNDGNEIPMLAYGLGTADFKENGMPVNQIIVKLTTQAIKAGFRHLDSAEVDGNEEELGLAINSAGVPRETLYIVTKLFNFHTNPKEAIEASLKRMALEYVDLYLIHSPFHAGSNIKLQETWADFEDIKRSGKARSIGVSNFSQKHLETVLKTAIIPPAINQIKHHPYLQQNDLLEFHRKHHIAVAAYGTLTPLTQTIDGLIPSIWSTMAAKYGVSEPVVGLRWGLEQDIVIITTTSQEQRMKEIVSRVTTFSLSENDLEAINQAGQQQGFRGS
ncbi:putative aldo/keto reductase [Colletotrichum scovillei]|uniref:Aldo/keto reductase n=1 Tax=Colletotrichum scovillei TaxID=1209932 RepID=A0A9P7QS94_9PEZI|nr:putative aldo/keto reductase [Colletotrichum scovillei]KAF4775366.1 putative aldo/keto reductase [Colletotrichum scovillei]KAG7038297.1 Aldo/keto reductase [Colletotrichum scovillei]KAG7040620.1 Aldo/keto reductase [Colletotrichum scovillei]KAG7060667.1 Aldo/keto reductase [Colletotrichum scovillei]